MLLLLRMPLSWQYQTDICSYVWLRDLFNRKINFMKCGNDFRPSLVLYQSVQSASSFSYRPHWNTLNARRQLIKESLLQKGISSSVLSRYLSSLPLEHTRERTRSFCWAGTWKDLAEDKAVPSPPLPDRHTKVDTLSSTIRYTTV